MRIVAKPIDMLVSFSRKGELRPIRFRVAEEDESNSTINIDRVLHRDLLKENGSNIILIKCQSCINGVARTLEIKYETATCRWVLFRI